MFKVKALSWSSQEQRTEWVLLTSKQSRKEAEDWIDKEAIKGNFAIGERVAIFKDGKLVQEIWF